MVAEHVMHKRIVRLMGNRFEICVCGDDASWAEQCIDKAIIEIQRIEKLLTTFDEGSETNLINRNAGIMPVKVSAETFYLVRRSIKLSDLTQGAFDITYGSVDKRLWNFDTTMTSLPDPVIARRSVRLINYRNIILDNLNLTVFLKEKGMRIGFGGIGKGYAADRARTLLQNEGVKDGFVNAAGDLTAWGNQPDGKPWTIGIANPDAKQYPFSTLQISDSAVATSGNYEKFVVIDGNKYSHTIDPKTGLPVTGIKSVTIISPHAEVSDALATPVMIMGTEVGLDLINQIHGIGCIIVDDHNRIYTSKNINLK